MAYKEFTEEEQRNIAEAIEQYKLGMRSRDICEAYHIPANSFYYYLKKAGVEVRNPNKKKHTTTTRGGLKRCTKCGNKNNPKNAKFCFMCGADIRSNIDILIEKLQLALSNTSFLPSGVREETSETIREALNELKKL